ncbi:MAG: CRISPR-associated endonuclease Cas2 [bacterium]|nr:CRISPR-associated endonuclease Cas2 [bacterium]
MYLIVMYDISNDRIRTKVASACEDYGLDRIQLSAFYGELTKTHQNELMHKMRRLLGKQEGKITLIPIATQEWERRQEVYNEGDA